MHEGMLRERLRAEINRAQTPPHPDVEPVLAGGRRRRRARHVSYTAGGLAAVAAVTLAVGYVGSTLGGSSPDSARVAAGPNASVPGGYQDVVDRIDTVTRAHLPGTSLRTDDIYPSDWTRDTALPATEWQNATDWHGLFTVAAASGDQDLWVSAMYIPASEQWSMERDATYCAKQDAIRCEVEGTTNAWTVVSEMVTTSDGVDTAWLSVRMVRDGGAYSNLVRVGVHVSSLQRARELWAVDAGQLRAIATDPDLAVPKPVVWPSTD